MSDPEREEDGRGIAERLLRNERSCACAMANSRTKSKRVSRLEILGPRFATRSKLTLMERSDVRLSISARRFDISRVPASLVVGAFKFTGRYSLPIRLTHYFPSFGTESYREELPNANLIKIIRLRPARASRLNSSSKKAATRVHPPPPRVLSPRRPPSRLLSS